MLEFDEYDVTSCRLCGRYVFPLSGWTEYLHSYRLMRAVWLPQRPHFEGPLHFSCLRAADFRNAFREEFGEIALTSGQELVVQADDEVHTLRRPGFGFIRKVFHGERCVIHRSAHSDTWIVLEHDGPWYFLNPVQLSAIAEGAPARSEASGDRTILPEQCADIARSASLPDLLERAGVLDLYEEALRTGDVEYEVFDYYPPKRILEYSVENVLPIPQEAYDFLREYARTYEPIDFDKLEENEEYL